MQTEPEKFPSRVQKLFAPKLPLVYVPPTDYPIENRRTNNVTPISHLKSQYMSYIQEELPAIEAALPTKAKSDRQIKQAAAEVRRKKLEDSFAAQLDQWTNGTEDPSTAQPTASTYNTVFVSRLNYVLTELDVSSVFTKYGIIESIRIVRDKNGKSRGYAFIVFEREVDAQNCVHELARTGVKVPVPAGSSAAGTFVATTSLVDIERGRIVRNWKPRRLGGGLGGRHYTKPDARFSAVASAAASGRRLNIANNPQLPSQSGSSQYGNSGHSSQYSNHHHGHSTHTSYASPVAPVAPAKPQSVRDKYAKYASVATSYESSASGSRSIRSIRRME